ncbi:MAG: transcription antitermination factor NusB [Myxococcota bacterium]
MGDRRQARELALMILYQLDVSKMTVEAGLTRAFAFFDGSEPVDPPPPFLEAVSDEPPPSPAAKVYAEALVRGVVTNQDAIDEALQKASTHWRLDRMARVDRNLLRLGAYEILHAGEEIPRKVAINEAVEVAKRFGTQESPAFINGILDRLGKKDGG